MRQQVIIADEDRESFRHEKCHLEGTFGNREFVNLAPVEANSGGFAHRLTPYVLCSYDVDCEDIADLRTDADGARLGVPSSDLACAWGDSMIAGRQPASWRAVARLLADGYAGILVPSYAYGATADDQNLVLWRWGPDLPHKVMVYDPTGKLPKNQLSWT